MTKSVIDALAWFGGYYPLTRTAAPRTRVRVETLHDCASHSSHLDAFRADVCAVLVVAQVLRLEHGACYLADFFQQHRQALEVREPSRIGARMLEAPLCLELLLPLTLGGYLGEYARRLLTRRKAR